MTAGPQGRRPPDAGVTPRARPAVEDVVPGARDAAGGGRDGLVILGWKEVIELPEWGIRELRAKLDTGANASAMHVQQLLDVGETGRRDHDGTPLPIVRFVVPLTRDDTGPATTIEAPVVAYRSIQDTRARPERRPVVRTRLCCGPIDEVIDITLTRRSGMLFRMTIGRRALRGRALVDPGSVFTLRTGAGDAVLPRP